MIDDYKVPVDFGTKSFCYIMWGNQNRLHTVVVYGKWEEDVLVKDDDYLKPIEDIQPYPIKLPGAFNITRCNVFGLSNQLEVNEKVKSMLTELSPDIILAEWGAAPESNNFLELSGFKINHVLYVNMTSRIVLDNELEIAKIYINKSKAISEMEYALNKHLVFYGVPDNDTDLMSTIIKDYHESWYGELPETKALAIATVYYVFAGLTKRLQPLKGDV